MIVFATNITERLSYTVSTILGKTITVTNDFTYANDYKGLVLNYSKESHFNQEIWVNPIGLLEQTDINAQNINCFIWRDCKAFFKAEGNIGFDFLAASFYLITRYEEYIEPNKDIHGRFNHKDSLAFKEDFLNIPLINIWLTKIKLHSPHFLFRQENFSFTTSFDVDIAFAYKHHGFLKNLLSASKDLITFQWKRLAEKFSVLLLNKPDPYFIFDWLNDLHKKHKSEVIYFLMPQLKKSSYDANVSVQNIAMQTLYCSLSKNNSHGIHPTFIAGNQQLLNNNFGFIKEKKILESVINNEIINSRQHYLLLQFPNTYEILIQQNIKHDYTLGYSTTNGFRASYCNNFYWFNIQQNITTPLLLHPFCYMDSTNIYHLKLTQAEALTEFEKLYEINVKYGGQMIAVFHNHFMTNEHKGKGWQKTYENILQHSTNKKLPINSF